MDSPLVLRDSSPASSRSQAATSDLFPGYYHGLPTCPKLLARSNPVSWWQPRDPLDRGFPALKSIRCVDSSHPICRIWDEPLGQALLDVIDDHALYATSVDICRICYEWEADSAPPIIWIGVEPHTLSTDSARLLVHACACVLADHGLNDVNVEVRESRLVPTAAPALFDPTDFDDLPPKHASPFSSAIGLAITTFAKPNTMGSSAFYLRDAGDPTDILLLTAQHVVSGGAHVNGTNGQILHPRFRKSSRPTPIDTVCFNRHWLEVRRAELDAAISEAREEIAGYDHTILSSPKELQVRRATENRQQLQSELSSMENARDILVQNWFGNKQVPLGEVFCYPPVRFNVQPHGWTEDWALLRMYPERLPKTVINCLDLSVREDYQSANHAPGEPRLAINKPGILKLRGIVSQAEMDQGPLVVLMRGAVSGLQVGESLSVNSMTSPTWMIERTSREDDSKVPEGWKKPWCREWTVRSLKGEGEMSYSRFPTMSHSSFSLKGDSGAGVVTRDGRIGGILTGGTLADLPGNKNGRVDLTYVTPMHFLIERMKERGISDPQLL